MREISVDNFRKLKPKTKASETSKLAEQAIASMRDSVNNNQAVMGEIIKRLSNRPEKFLIVRDAKGDMNEIIPVYKDSK